MALFSPTTSSVPTAAPASFPRRRDRVRHEGFELPAHASAVSQARREVCGRLRRWGLSEGLSDVAQLVISEFFTNAVVHTDSARVRCRLEVSAEALRIEVTDEGDGPAVVAPREPGTEDVGGRGLQLVGAVAEKWGVAVPGGGRAGRVVWAELGLPAR